MSLDAQIANMVKNVPECVAAGVVDIQTGMLLGIKTIDSHPQEVIDLVAAATGDLFQGPNVNAIEDMFKKLRGVTDTHHYFQEIIIMSDNLVHVFQRGKKNEDVVVIVICRASASLGMILSKARTALPLLEAAI